MHISTEVGNDLSIEKYLEIDINRCEELIDICLNNVDEKQYLISVAISVGSSLQLEKYVKKAIELCSHPNNIVKKRALFSLGKIDYKSDNKLINEVLNTIKGKVSCSIEDLYPDILRTTCLLYKQKQDLEQQIIRICTTILKNKSDELLYSVSQILLYEGASLSKPIYNILLNTLSKVDKNNKTTLDLIDHILCNLLNNQEKNQLYSFLENLLIKNNIQITIFNSFVHELLTRKHEALNTLITRWFLSQKLALGHAIEEILSSSNKKIELVVDGEQIKNLPKGVTIFLAHKACGWLYYRYLDAITYIVSLIDFSTDEELVEISAVLLYPLAISYPYQIKKYLEDLLRQKISDKTREIINSLLNQLDDFLKDLNGDKDIPELRPSLSQLEQYHQHRLKFMDKVYKTAEEKSIINQIATKKTILYGSSSILFRYHNPDGSNKTREIMSFNHFSHSIAYPSLGLLDPHNLDFALRTFCVEGCNETSN